MTRIYNNPTGSNARRMPVIMPKELQYEWLKPISHNVDKAEVQELIKPFEDAQFEAHSVDKILGKYAINNKPETLEKVEYEELEGVM